MPEDTLIQNIEVEEPVVSVEETPEWAQINPQYAEQSGQARSFSAPVTHVPQWARVARGGYEVSSEGDARFSALSATFAEGTFLGDVDISGRTVEDVYQNVLKRSGKGLPPAADSILHNPDLKTDEERQEYSYENGYLPLWSIWADQNEALVDELARRSAGRSLTDRFASTAVNQARALSEIIRGERAYFDEEDLARISPSRSKVSAQALRDYDVYTLGIGKRSIEEFRNLIPDDVTMVVDTRHYTANRFVPEYKGSNLEAMFSRMGVSYTWMRPLSGVPADKRRKEEADWQAVSQGDDFKKSLAAIADAVSRGQKVLLIGSDSNPEYGPRALLDAMELERSTEIRVGHIDTNVRGARVRSTEEVVKRVLGRSVIHNGDYLGVHFNDKRRVVALDEGTNLIKVAGDDTNSRVITGNWNYSTPVQFVMDDSPRNNERQEILRSAFTKVNDAADHTIIFSVGDADRDVRDQIGIAGHQGTRISLPTHREDLYDPDRIAAAASRIRERISRDLTWRMLHSGVSQVNPDSLVIAVGGAHIARISNAYVEEAVPGEFADAVRQARQGGSHEDFTGMKMDDISGIGQDDVDYFITEVLRRLQSDPGEFGEDAEMTPIKLSGIITTGNSGVPEAATKAAQSLGLNATVIAPKGWRMTIDDESLRGMDIEDRAAFENRYHLGYRNDVTLQNLQEQLDERDRRSMMRDDGMTGGLTDRQIAVLYHLGFGNNALNDMMEVATANNLRIDNPADMADFIRNCAEGYGISSIGAAEKERVRALFEESSRMSAEWNTVLDLIRQARETFIGRPSDVELKKLRASVEDTKNLLDEQTATLADPERVNEDWNTVIALVGQIHGMFDNSAPEAAKLLAFVALVEEKIPTGIDPTAMDKVAFDLSIDVDKLRGEFISALEEKLSGDDEDAKTMRKRIKEADDRIEDLWNKVSEIQGNWNMEDRVRKMLDDITETQKQLDSFYLRTKEDDVDLLIEDLAKTRKGWEAVLDRVVDAAVADRGEMEESAKEDRVRIVTEMFSDLSKEMEALTGRAMDIRIDALGGREDIVGEEQVKKAWEDVIAMENTWRENGVGYVTPMSPDYPQNLREMNVEGEERTTRPAILWYKGDLTLMDRPSVAVTGVPVSTTESIAAARFLGGRLADEDIVLIANMSQLRQGATSAALQEHTEKGGRSVAITPEGLGSEENREAQEAVVKRGGLVASTKEPGAPSAGDKAVKYTEFITQTAGSVIGIVDGAMRGDERANPASILANLSKVAFSLGEAAVIGVTAGVEKLHENAENKKAEKEKEGEQNAKQADIRQVKANMDGVSEIVGTARNLQETAYLDNPATDWKVKPVEEKAEKKETVSETESESVRQRPVHVLRIGSDEIFFVPDNQEAVRQAVLAKHPKALFAAPDEEKGILARLRGDEITLDGARVAVHGDQKGTAPLRTDPDLRTEFFFRDRLLTVDQVPNGAMGLADRTVREDNVRWFEWMKDMASGIRADFKEAIGLRRDAPDMRFDNADYLVIGRNSIEIRRGDDTTASIRLTDQGKIRISNSTRLADDVSEHYSEEHYPALTAKVTGGALTEAAARALVDELREAIMDRPHSETLAVAAMDRDERSERKERLDNGFLNNRDDNVTVAMRDLAEAEMQNTASRSRTGDQADRLRVLATLMYEEKTTSKLLENRAREQAREAKALSGIPAENAAERDEAERRIDDLYQERVREAAHLARIQELKTQVVAARSLLELSRQEGEITYSVDGGVIRLSEHKVSAKALEGAAAELERLSGELDVNGYRTAAAMEIVSSIRAENERKNEERAEKESKKSEAEAAVEAAKRESIVKDFKNGVCVIAVTGGVAYADKDLNVISQTYHELSDMSASMGLAKNEKGQMKLIRPDGSELNGHWFDGISQPNERISVVKGENGYNHLNLDNGKLVSKEWRPGVGSFHEGRSVVKNAEGKFNYIDTSGKPLLNNWVEKASDFKDGVAHVILKDTKFEIDLAGNILRNITKEQKETAEKKQPSFQRKPGDN